MLYINIKICFFNKYFIFPTQLLFCIFVILNIILISLINIYYFILYFCHFKYYINIFDKYLLLFCILSFLNIILISLINIYYFVGLHPTQLFLSFLMLYINIFDKYLLFCRTPPPPNFFCHFKCCIYL